MKKTNVIALLLISAVSFSQPTVTSTLTANSFHIKKNYFSFETGVSFGNANNNIESNMIRSHFADDSYSSFFGLFNWTTKYPRARTGKAQYRIRAGHFLNNKTAIEAGYGLSFYGNVQGFNNSAGHLTIGSKIRTLYIACIKTDSRGSAGFGGGPVLSFYQLTTIANYDPQQPRNYLLPGGMITGFWNFFTGRSLFAGMRSELSFTTPAKIDEIKISHSGRATPEAKFNSTKAGSFTGSVSLNAGIRF